MAINWFPGHMVGARREIQENMKVVDFVLMLLDARAPFSCRNRLLEKMTRGKTLIYILNKADLADPQATKKYIRRLKQEGFEAVAMDSAGGRGKQNVLNQIRKMYAPAAETMKARGRRIRPARIMVAGVPNVGKSTFLNCLVGKNSVKTGNKPGVTRGRQWVRVLDDMELLDTPGLMWPKVESEEQGYKLALLNIVGEKAYQEYDAACFLARYLQKHCPEEVEKQLGEGLREAEHEEILIRTAQKRGYLNHGAQPDLEKAAHNILQDFRRGNWGRISLDD